MNQQVQQNMMPGPYKTFQPNQTVVNPVDGKSYNVVQQNPGQGLTLKDPQTQETLMVDEQNSQNLQPSIKTSGISVEDIANEIVAGLTGEELPKVEKVEKKKFGAKNMEALHRWPENRKRVKAWLETRQGFKTKSQLNQKEISESPTYNESRQNRAIREIGLNRKEAKFDPHEGDLIKEVGRDRKTHLPMRGGDDIEVGLTEFPKDIDKEKNPEGYSAMTMKEMDDKFEDDWTHYPNEQALPSNTKMRKEDETYKPKFKDKDEEIRYAMYDEALDKVLGIKKKLAADESTEPTKLPIQYKDVKTAPKLEEYTEPDVLDEASSDIKTAVEMLKNTQDEITRIQKEIQDKTQPLQKAIFEATKGLQEELAKNAALLKTSLDLVYSELEKTGDRVAVLGDEIYAAVSREEAKAKPASLPQILKKAHDINPQVEEEIKKIKALLESDNTTLVIEQYLYKYPVSEIQKKKISVSAMEGNFEELINNITDIIDELKGLNEIL